MIHSSGFALERVLKVNRGKILATNKKNDFDKGGRVCLYSFSSRRKIACGFVTLNLLEKEKAIINVTVVREGYQIERGDFIKKVASQNHTLAKKKTVSRSRRYAERKARDYEYDEEAPRTRRVVKRARRVTRAPEREEESEAFYDEEDVEERKVVRKVRDEWEDEPTESRRRLVRRTRRVKPKYDEYEDEGTFREESMSEKYDDEYEVDRTVTASRYDDDRYDEKEREWEEDRYETRRRISSRSSSRREDYDEEMDSDYYDSYDRDRERNPNQIRSDRGPIHRYNASLGALIASKFMAPFLDLQMYVMDEIAIGLKPYMFSKASSGVKAQSLGAIASVNYYMDGLFQGLWLQGGLGINRISFDLTGLGPFNKVSGLVTVGWRHKMDSGLNLGGAVGVHFMPDVNLAPLNLSYDFDGIQPVLSLDVSYAF